MRLREEQKRKANLTVDISRQHEKRDIKKGERYK
jgi:hypothetical protein